MRAQSLKEAVIHGAYQIDVKLLVSVIILQFVTFCAKLDSFAKWQ